MTPGPENGARCMPAPRVADAPNHLKVYFVPVVYGRYEVAFVDEDYTRRRGVRAVP